MGAKLGPKPKIKTETCSNCFSHRDGNAKGLYSGKPVCHFYPEPTVCRSVDHWCRQWEDENLKALAYPPPHLQPNDAPPTMA